MHFQFYIEKLKDSENFKKFIKERPKAYFCSAFLIIDKSGKENKAHLDYYDPSKEELFGFEMENKANKVQVDTFGQKDFIKLSDKIDFNFEEIEELLEKERQKKELKQKIQKILLSFQRLNDKNYLVGTIFVTKMGMVKFQIDLDSKKVLQFEKKSFFDIMKVKKNVKKE